MKAGNETEIYRQGYKDGYNDGENARIDPDYWTRLEHQYAGMAMQGLISRVHWPEVKDITEYAVKISHALVEKMKEERK